MRLSNSLVVAVAAVLLASGNALAPATGAGQATVSRLASLESGNQIDGLANENKRSLRGREAADNDDGAVDEERYQQWKIDDLVQSKWTDLFKIRRGKFPHKLLKHLSKDQVDTILKYY